MAARLNKMHQESVRAKIQTAKLLNLLHDDAFGVSPLSDGSRQSAMYLLTQAIGKPHQSVAIEHTHSHVSELTDSELEHLATASSGRAAEKAKGPKEPTELH